jgi:hypothetical protein
MGLREQATLDARAILEDTSGFAWPVTLTSPAGVVSSLQGFTADVGQIIDPETGQAVAGRRASVTLARAALPALPEAVADKGRKPWLASFADSRGAVQQWKVIEVLPDAAIGVVVLLLELYALATVRLAGALVLPPLQLSGSLVPAFEGELVLPGLQVAGGLQPVVGVAGALALPGLQVAGGLQPVVGVGGSPALPGLQVAGGLQPVVGSLSGSLVLPSLQLSGTITVNASPIAAWLRTAQGTVTGSGYSSIPDLLAGTSPAIQTTDTNRPVNGTSANGLPIATYSNDFLNWPLSAPNNNATKSGFACWAKLTLGGFQNLFVIWAGGGGASANKLDYFLSGSNLQALVEVGGQAALSSFMSSNAWHFVTMEYDGAQATNAARCLCTVDGIVLGTTNTAIPASQATPSGNAWIGGFGASQFLQGSLGPNFWWLNRQLTATERNNLMNFEAPT